MLKSPIKLYSIPNVLTGMNILCGCFAIVSAVTERLTWTPYWIIGAAIFDFLDGFVARVFNKHSEIGLQLDSLADMVSFGLAPAIIAWQLMRNALYMNPFSGPSWALLLIEHWPFMIAVFSAFRLAKFNVDTRQSYSFIGLPTPANALFFAGLIWAIEHRILYLSSLSARPFVLVCFIDRK